MRRDQQDQSILLLGETGSGKSEVRKNVVRHLCAISKSANKKSKVISGVVKTETILDSLGNAATIDNPSSSRFGRYVEYQFDQAGKLVGAKLLDYMLEKSRIIATPPNERNFNIFYQMLAGVTPEERTTLRLQGDPSHYAYLSGSKASRVNLRDASDFATLREHMTSVGIGRRLQAGFLQTLSAILHLGNIAFFDDPNKPGEACEVKNHDLLAFVSSLLGVLPINLEFALTYKTKIIRRERCTVFLTAEDAAKQRNNLAMTLYSRLFSWIVEHLNTRLDSGDSATFIGVIDLPGFQDYHVNKFDQFLFNYANERLQQFSVNRIFKERRDMYAEEGIPHSTVTYPSNVTPVQLLDGDGSGSPGRPSLLSILNECTKQPNLKRPDGKLVEALAEKLAANPAFVSAASTSTGAPEKGDSQHSSLAFGVRHYAGQVMYDAAGFVESNTEEAPLDFLTIFLGNEADIPPTSNVYVRMLFSSSASEHEQILGDTFVGKPPAVAPRRQPSMKKRKAAVRLSAQPTVTETLQASLTEAFDALAETVPWIIFCLKPNEDLGDQQFDSQTVKGQIAHLGICQAIQDFAIADYTASCTFDEFRTRYRVIVEPMRLDSSSDAKALCNAFVNASNWTSKEMAVGKTRVFLAEEAWRALEDDSALTRRRATCALGGLAADNFSPRGVERSDIEMGTLEKSAADGDLGKPDVGKQKAKKPRSSPARRKWLCVTWCLTWWIPDCCLTSCGKMKRPDIRMAWREKVALCIIILFLNLVILFFIVVFGQLLCPAQTVFSRFELAGFTDTSRPYVSAYGRVFRIDDIVNTHVGLTPTSGYGMQRYQWSDYVGSDVSRFFYKTSLFSQYCPGISTPPPDDWDNLPGTRESAKTSKYPYHHAIVPSTGAPRQYIDYMNQYAVGRLAWPMYYIKSTASPSTKLIVIYDNVYDVSSYSASNNFLGSNVQTLFNNFYGRDATPQWEQIKAGEGAAQAKAYLNCMNQMFYIGTVDHRNDFSCQFSNYILIAATVVVVLVIGVKFLAALQVGISKEPEDHDKFVICQIPCYTEGQENLTRSLESLAQLQYDDKRKLILVIADGMIIGSGNDRPTPRIALDILGVDQTLDPEPKAFQSLGEGDKQLNYGKVYSGLYEVQGHSVPFIVIVKVGKASERNRPGNRGKRDSQLILMRFLSKVHLNGEMTPLELELYHHMKNVIGVNPSFYEYVLMVDADTEVFPDSLNRMISAMIHDSRIMGICGETLISNETDTFTTMMQVYEYFISHHLAKAFESLFGSVTCLPGCFCMYRVRTPTKNVPLLIAPAVVNDYSENNVNTLHLKNLLHLGEDRYLTTLMMKHFPNMKLSFTPDAHCMTSVPDRWAVLLSQRRRWINSTVHNLVELGMLSQLCGFCCFSMRFVVFLDLFSTVVQPAGIVYIGYLLYAIIAHYSQFPLISLIMIAVIYGLQVFIFVLKRQWAQIGWLFIYLLAMPVTGFYVPLYAFWHFDDFSWGNTRVVTGEDGKQVATADFDPTTIPVKKWGDHERELHEKLSERSDSRARRRGPQLRRSSPAPALARLEPFTRRLSPAAAAAARGRRARASGRAPSDDEILRELKRILASANLMSITKKQARDELSAIFGADMAPKKALINQFIDEILQGRL
ncbi:chitin synthase-domain-containing protein [Zopfochytrium polystomum]|nr:chitin synthase-domain-containing protein [Zopfochytrium polystomum]